MVVAAACGVTIHEYTLVGDEFIPSLPSHIITVYSLNKALKTGQ